MSGETLEQMPDMSSMRSNVILPAGGTGQRMSISTPKQYCLLRGRPLISYTIELFERIRWIDCIYVCVAHSWLDHTTDILMKYKHKKVRLVEAAETRHLSIYNGIKAIDEDDSESKVVIIHDAVRLFVDEQIIEDVVNAAFTHGAAGVTRPLISTVIALDKDDFLDHSLDRTKYQASEMPQAFQFNIIKTAYEKATDYDFEYGTECLHLAQKYSECKAKIIRTTGDLWKVTYKRDLYAAEALLKEKSNSVAFVNCCEDNQSLVGELNKSLEDMIQDSANNYVFIMNSVDKNELKLILETYELELTGGASHAESVVNGFSASHERRGCLLFLFPREAESFFLEIRDVFHEFTNSSAVVMCLAVIMSQNYSQVASMVRSLILDGNLSLNGQVLFAAG
ncbi:D-ribitol-5-phosphate cytidylyltransferase-like [Tubulanus polymorphus]|uniref:D-ribitol-5-phosphate cytidylyltransferase-like n=1 Tax=Tubulanus polymorphus TaxID=672921 RepID=UPI003DA6CC81